MRAVAPHQTAVAATQRMTHCPLPGGPGSNPGKGIIMLQVLILRISNPGLEVKDYSIVFYVTVIYWINVIFFCKSLIVSNGF